MTGTMFGADKIKQEANQIYGVISSGGTESILLAMKTYRDWARDKKGINEPEMILPTSAHASFEKACLYFNIKPVYVPLNNEYKADVSE